MADLDGEIEARCGELRTGGVSGLVRQPGKLVGGEGLLDQWEEHLFLVADVLLEPLPELV